MIPEGWREVKIAEVAKIDVGRDLVEERFARTSSDTHCYPVYSNTVEQHGHYGYYDFAEYSVESVTVVGRGIGLGTAFARTKPFGAIGRLLVLSPKNASFDVGYLADYLNHGFEIHYESGGIPQLPGKTLGNYSILLPPLAQQRRIAKILSIWDRAIETVEALIANACTQKKALMHSLLTGKKRLPGAVGRWSDVTLENLAKITMGSSPPSSSYNEFGQGLPLIQGNADVKMRVSAPRIHTSLITQTCSPGDILFSVRAPVGEIAISLHRACIGRGIAAIQPRLRSDVEFLYYALLLAEPGWAALSQGSTFQAVNSKDLKGFVFRAPVEAAERQLIGKVVGEAQKMEQLLRDQLAALHKEKSALMQQLLTGKRRVKVNEVETA